MFVNQWRICIGWGGIYEKDADIYIYIYTKIRHLKIFIMLEKEK